MNRCTCISALIRNTFKLAGFEKPAIDGGVDVLSVDSDGVAVGELDRVLKHLTIGAKVISAYDYVVRYKTEFSEHKLIFFFRSFQRTDDQIHPFNEWNYSSDKILSIQGIKSDDGEAVEEIEREEPPPLAESL